MSELKICKELESLLPGLEYSRQTHVLWRDCEQKYRDENPEAGDKEHHIQCIEEYDQRIATIKDAINTITEQEKVISELDALVESAFREGYSLGYGDGNSDGQSYCGKPCRGDDEQWKLSDAIEELAKHKQPKGE